MDERMNAMWRCVGCLSEMSQALNSPFGVCEPCQKQMTTVPIATRIYQYRRNQQSSTMSGRREEIVRKIARGRLDESIQIFGFFDDEWQWGTLKTHPDFAELFVVGTPLYQKSKGFKSEQKDTLQQVRLAKRRSVVLGLITSCTLLTTAWFGFQEGWFLVEMDPFSVSQGDDVEVPADLLEVLNINPSSVSNKLDNDFWSMEPIDIDSLQKMFWSDLANNPRQGRELLLWLQTLLLRPKSFSFMQDGLFPPAWLGFALSLEHPPDLGHRVKALWRAVQGDVGSMAKELELCGSDRWCQALKAALSQEWTANLEPPGLVILSEYALHREEVAQWRGLAERLISANEVRMGQMLMAEYAIQTADDSLLAESLDSLPEELIVDLWRLRTDLEQLPESVSSTKKRPDWNSFPIQIQGAWALEQAGRWLRVSQSDSLQRINEWFSAGDWLEGDFPGVMLSDRFILIQAQALIQNDQRKEAIAVLSSLQQSFQDDLLNLWLGLLWIQVEDLRNASTIAERLSKEGSHYWLLQVFISVQSQNSQLIRQSLDRIVFTDVEGTLIRQVHQTWIPQFDWSPLLFQARNLVEQGTLSKDYGEILKWLAGEAVTFRAISPNWTTGWAAKTQYALQRGQYNQAFSAVTRLRRLAPNEPGAEILSQMVNVQIGRSDIASRELKLFAQKERSSVWNRWLLGAFEHLGDDEMIATYRAKLHPKKHLRNISSNIHTIWDDVPND